MSQTMVSVELEKLRALLPKHRIVPVEDMEKMGTFVYRLFQMARADSDKLRSVFTLLNEFFSYYIASDPGPFREAKESLIKRLDALLPPVH